MSDINRLSYTLILIRLINFALAHNPYCVPRVSWNIETTRRGVLIFYTFPLSTFSKFFGADTQPFGILFEEIRETQAMYKISIADIYCRGRRIFLHILRLWSHGERRKLARSLVRIFRRNLSWKAHAIITIRGPAWVRERLASGASNDGPLPVRLIGRGTTWTLSRSPPWWIHELTQAT